MVTSITKHGLTAQSQTGRSEISRTRADSRFSAFVRCISLCPVQNCAVKPCFVIETTGLHENGTSPNFQFSLLRNWWFIQATRKYYNKKATYKIQCLNQQKLNSHVGSRFVASSAVSFLSGLLIILVPGNLYKPPHFRNKTKKL